MKKTIIFLVWMILFLNSPLLYADTGKEMATPQAMQNLPSNSGNFWAKFNEGSWVLFDMHMTGPNGERVGQDGARVKMILISKGPGQLTIREEMTGMGPSTNTVELNMPFDATPTDLNSFNSQGVTYLCDETISVKGSPIACKVFEINKNEKGVETHGKMWVSDKIPGALVNLQTRANTPNGPVGSIFVLLDYETHPASSH